MSWYNPYAATTLERRQWYKCNFHAHELTYEGEVRFDREAILRMYRDANYDVITFSNQTEWVDSATLAASIGMSGINGEEYARTDGFLLLGTERFIDGEPQEAIDACLAEGGLCVACHPHMNEAFVKAMPGRFTTPELIRSLKGLCGVEILNGALGRKRLPAMKLGDSETQPATLGRSLAVDTWDELLCEGRRIWGFGSDDSHVPAEIDRAWTMIYASSTGFDALKSAIMDGCLYVSTGLMLKTFTWDGNLLTVGGNFPHLEDAKLTYRFISDGEIIAEQRAYRSELAPPPGALYVRAEIIADDGSKLWTQPLLRDEIFMKDGMKQ